MKEHGYLIFFFLSLDLSFILDMQVSVGCAMHSNCQAITLTCFRRYQDRDMTKI